MRVILRGPLGFRSAVIPEPGDGRPDRLRLETGVTLAIGRFVYAPSAALVSWLARWVRALQSGSLSMYLLYMLVALLAALSLVPILR
jgi:hypothetical protein